MIYFIGLLVSLLFSVSALGAGFKDQGAVEFNWSKSAAFGTPLLRAGDGLILAATTSKFLFLYPGTFDVLRYGLDGVRDMSFGTAGQISLPLKGQSIYVRPRALLSGKLVFLGVKRAGMTEDFDIMLYRTSAKGISDKSFGQGGEVRIDFDFGTEDQPTEIIPLPGDEMLLIGASTDQTVVRHLLIKLNADGGIDPFFGHNGAVDLPIPKGANSQFVFPGPKGTLVIFGSTFTGGLFSTRFFLDGKLDPTYGKGGLIEYDFTPQPTERWLDVAPAASGGYVTLGQYTETANSKERTFIARVNELGGLDATFGKAGVVASRDEKDELNLLKALQPADGGGFVGMGGYFADNQNSLMFFKFAADGSLDPAFGKAGIAAKDFPGKTFGSPLSLVADGTDWIAQATVGRPQAGLVLVRFDAKGAFLGPNQGVVK